MSARHRQPEVISRTPTRIADWSGALSPLGIVGRLKSYRMAGSLRCSHTGWQLAVEAQVDPEAIYLSAWFDGPVFADDAAPWTAEHGLGKPHQTPLAGYDCFWTGSMRPNGPKAWSGMIGDRYGGRLAIEGKAQGAGVISLRAAVPG